MSPAVEVDLTRTADPTSLWDAFELALDQVDLAHQFDREVRAGQHHWDGSEEIEGVPVVIEVKPIPTVADVARLRRRKPKDAYPVVVARRVSKGVADELTRADIGFFDARGRLRIWHRPLLVDTTAAASETSTFSVPSKLRLECSMNALHGRQFGPKCGMQGCLVPGLPFRQGTTEVGLYLTQHVAVAPPHEAINHVCLGHGPRQFGDQPRLDAHGEPLAIYQHAVTVEDHKLDGRAEALVVHIFHPTKLGNSRYLAADGGPRDLTVLGGLVVVPWDVVDIRER